MMKLICVALLFCASSVFGILLDEDSCMAPPPCVCPPDKIVCDSNNFTTIPTFSPSTVRMDTLTIYLPANRLVSIPANAFENINTTHARSISILFQSNLLRHIDRAAFAGIEDTVVELFFQDNKFTSFPEALTTLTNLRAVHFQANPMSRIDAYVTSQMSPTLETLELYGDYLQYWPSALGELKHLKKLSISNAVFTSIPNDAFCGLTSLTSLDIDSRGWRTSLAEIPASVCLLKKLVFLRIDNFLYSTPEQMTSFFETCRQKALQNYCYM